MLSNQGELIISIYLLEEYWGKGLGSAPHSHAVADAKHPAEQGFTAMIVGWYFFAESNVKIVINSKAMTLNVFKGRELS